MLSGGKWDKIHENVRRIFSAEGISPTVNTCEGGYREVKIIEDFYQGRNPREYDEYAPTIRADREGLKVSEPIAFDEQNKCLRYDGTIGTLTTDGSTPKHNNRVVEPNVNVIGNYHNSNHEASRIVDSEGIYPTMKENHGTIPATIEKPTYCIRKLTPLECIRLMDFDDSDYDKIKAIGMSDSQIYKQCGNSIVVACLEGIFRKMFIDTEVENEQLSLF